MQQAAADVARDGYITQLLTSAVPSFRGYAAANAICLPLSGRPVT